MGTELEDLMGAEQYSVPAAQKEAALAQGLALLTKEHLERCPSYASILSAWDVDADKAADDGPVSAVPYIPAALFKTLELKSIPDDAVFKVMTSSGTSGQVPSRIFLDIETARLQTRALSSIVTHYLGPKRLPMLIIDHESVIADRRSLSARTAGTVGMMNFGRDHLFALDDQTRILRPQVEEWLTAHAHEDLLIFGFTFMIWQDLLQPLRHSGLDLSRATLVHSGGWKKLIDLAVSPTAFRQELKVAFGIEHVHDFYGMVEQVGSVYFECDAGYFHAPNFADVIIRDPITWRSTQAGQVGVVEVVSLLPRSYPGHAILTQDLGVIHGVDDCACGRLGKRFSSRGRVPKAEIRGCSDTQVRN